MNVAENKRVFASQDSHAEPQFASTAHATEAEPEARRVANPFRRRQAQLYSVLLGAIRDERMEAITGKLLEQAADGNVSAAKLVLQYAIGKPTPAPNPDHVEIDEWAYFEKTAAMSDSVDKVVRSTEPETILNMGRELRPIMSELALKKFAKWIDVPSTNGDFSPGAPSPNGDFAAPAAGDRLGNAPVLSPPRAPNGSGSAGDG